MVRSVAEETDTIETKTYSFEVPTDIWNDWKQTVPRDKSLESALVDLIDANPDYDELVAYLDDFIEDHRDDESLSEEFMDGYEFARHHARDLQLTKTGGCDCGNTFPVKGEDGTWACQQCGAILLEDDTVGRPH